MQIIGHRGARGLAPENTLASLQKAVEHGADAVEFDLRVTKDKVVVLHHDAVVHDPAGERFTIADHPFLDLLAHQPNLATFEQVLDSYTGKLPLIAEVKPGVVVEPIITIIKDRMPELADQLSVCSYSQSILQELHRDVPTVSLIVNERWSGVRATHRARKLGTKRLQMNQLWLWSGFIRVMKRGGYQLSAYTLNNPQKARRWARAGLWGAITDYPDKY